jgi:hypothetical protein
MNRATQREQSISGQGALFGTPAPAAEAPQEPKSKKHRPGTKAFDRALLARVKAKPGQTIPELADFMECPQSRLYRVLPSMHKDGLVRREGRGWHTTDTTEAPA